MKMRNKKNKNNKNRISILCIALLLAAVLAVSAGCGSGAGTSTQSGQTGQNAQTGQADQTGQGTQTGQAGDAYAGIAQDAAKTAGVLAENVKNPVISSVGGEWLIIGLVHSGYQPPENYYDHYYDNVRAQVKKGKGILSEERYTEYARVILALCALGKDVSDVEGYDLRPFLDDYDRIEAQGCTAASFALIAANVCGFRLENENRYIELIINEAFEEEMAGNVTLTDYVSMGMQALAFYQDRQEVQEFMEKAIASLSEAQTSSGALNNAESTAECIIALTQAGIDPLKDERFVKDGHTLYDGLREFSLGDGMYFHDADLKEADAMASEKVLLALDALLLSREGKTLYSAEVN